MLPFWVALALLATSVEVLSTRYSGQLIAITGDEPTLDKAGKFLYDKNPEVSQVAKWYWKDPADVTKGGSFEQVKWDKSSQGFIRDPRSLERIPKNGRIQVVGHGDITNKKVTLGGFTAENLATQLKTIDMATPLQRVSLVGCSVGELTDKGTKFVGNEFPKTLLENMKGTAQEVSSRTKMVGVDSSGRKVYGEQTSKGVEWGTKPGDIYKSVASWKDGKVAIKKEPATEVKYEPPEDLKKMKYKAPDGNLEIERGAAGGADPEYAELGSNEIFYSIDDITKNYFDNIKVDPDWHNTNTHERVVNVKPKKGGAVKRETLTVREFTSYEEFSKEVKFWGDKGFTKPQRDPATKQPNKNKPDGTLYEEKYVHYRYGDFVYSFKYESSKVGPFALNPFYAELKGVIVNEDPGNSVSTDKNTHIDMKSSDFKFSNAYKSLQKKTNEEFFPNAQKWMEGDRSSIGTSPTDAINGETSLAMFHAEAVRDFRVHTTNKLSLDMASHSNEYHRNSFFKSHPIGRGSAGPAKLSGMREGFYGSEAKPTSGQEPLKVRALVSQVVEQWNNAGYNDKKRGTKRKTSDESKILDEKNPKRATLIQDWKDSIADAVKAKPTSGSEVINRDIAGPLSEPYDSRPIQEHQTECVSDEVEDYREAEDSSLSTRASDATLSDKMYVSEEMTKTVKRYEQTTGKDYEVKPDSVKYEKGKVAYEIFEPTDPISREYIETAIDEEELSSKKLMDEMQDRAEKLNKESGGPSGAKEGLNTGLAIYGAVMGLKGTIDAFERGDILNGSINLAQTLHGLGELSKVNKFIYSAAGKFVSKVASKSVNFIGKSVGKYLGEDIGKLFAREGSELLSSVGELGELAEDIPFIGTAFGVYNIYQDLQQHTVIGYVDAGLDILITTIGLLDQPELEPLVIALTIFRLGIDTFYADITKELDALPPDATIGDTFVAILKGIGEAILDIYDQVTGGIWSAPFKVAKLEKQYKKDQQFLAELGDYHNYYKITKCSGSSADINFAAGEESWNGGDILFTLNEGGLSGDLTMESTTTDGKEVLHKETRTFHTKVSDMTLGIGESHTVSFKTKSVKVFWVIPVDEESLISGLDGDRTTLHGEYNGNSDDNKFYAVQKMPSGLDYDASDYHYIVRGYGGNDSFYFGPQYMSADGGEGEDRYYVNENSQAEIRNGDNAETDDYLILPSAWQVGDYTCSYSHQSVVIEKDDLHIKLAQYGVGSSFQHIIIKSGDHFVSRVEYKETSGACSLVPYALSGAGSDTAINYDANVSPYSNYQQVTQLIGSDKGDTFFANDLDNVIIPGKGSDRLRGRNGQDTYNFQYFESGTYDEVDNYAVDEQLDTLIYPALTSAITCTPHSNRLDVVLSSTDIDGTYQVKVLNWFRGSAYQHLTVYTQDHIFMAISQIENDWTHCNLIPALKELTPGDSEVYLLESSVLRQVTSVAGSTDVDFNYISGNNLDNYIAGGSGDNWLAGREGEDQYVIKKSPPTSSRKKRATAAAQTKFSIMNQAGDGKVDMILYDENYDNIVLTVVVAGSSAKRAVGSIGGSADNSERSSEVAMSVLMTSTLTDSLNTVISLWFVNADYQHCLVRSNDGIVFSIPTQATTGLGPLQKIAIMIDKSKSDYPLQIDLRPQKFHSVERVTGTPHHDEIIGNSLNNYIDPREGGGRLTGGNGSDTYVIKKGYGRVTIINTADDNVADTVLLDAPYSAIVNSAMNSVKDLTLAYYDPVDATKDFSAVLFNYKADNRTRHLTILTSDGVTFVIDAQNGYSSVKIAINNVATDGDTTVDLAANPDLENVRAYYGSTSLSNNVTGNDQPNTIVGGNLNDYFYGGNGNDILKGGAGVNDLFGGEGNDTLVGGSGNDELQGGPGNDVLSAGAGYNIVDGGEGDDTVTYMGDPISKTGVYVDLNHEYTVHATGYDDVINVENVIATPYNDTLISSTIADNSLSGRGGPDTLYAKSGYDILIGGDGSDTYNLVEATGTKVIVNKANDTSLDSVDMTGIKKNEMRFERHVNSLIIRVVSDDFSNSDADQFPSCSDPIPGTIQLWPPVDDVDFCETYSLLDPTVVLQEYFAGSQHRHLAIVTEDCSLGEDFLTQMPINVLCN